MNGGRSFALADVKAADPAEGAGEFEAILSAPTVDRDGEVVAAGAFDPLPERIPIHADHAITTAGIIGSGTPWYDGDVLKVRGTLSALPAAQRIRQLIKEGHLTGMSVGFIAGQRQDRDGVPTVTKGELIEGSFVSVPSNRDAAVLAVKTIEAEQHQHDADVLEDDDRQRRLAQAIEVRARKLRLLTMT